MVYRYNVDGKLKTFATEQKSLIGKLVNISDDDARYCIGFDDNGIPILDETKKIHNEKIISNNKIYAQLAELDLKSIRAIRDDDKEWIAKYSKQAKELRAKLK